MVMDQLVMTGLFPAGSEDREEGRRTEESTEEKGRGGQR